MTEQNTIDLAKADQAESFPVDTQADAHHGGLAGVAALSAAAAAALSACGGGDAGSDAPGAGARDRAQSMAASTFTPTWPTWALPNYNQAWRFLQQASMGPTEGEVNAVVSMGFEAWLDAQLATPLSTSALTPDASYVGCFEVHCGTKEPMFFNSSPDGISRGMALIPQRPFGIIDRTGWERYVSFATWYKPYFNSDQLRQRVVHSLIQFLVLSLKNEVVSFTSQLAAGYLDMISENAFGNYRTLIENVARNPAMGHYLSHLGNRPPEFAATVTNTTNPPAIMRAPDQNFARELLQLFTIGLTKLNMDGSEVLVNNKPVMTTKREDIMVLSNVFTGWNYDADPALATPFLSYQYVDNATSASTAYTTIQVDDVDLCRFEANGLKVSDWWVTPHHRSKRLKAPMKGYAISKPWTQALGGNKVYGTDMPVHSTQTLVAAQLKVSEANVTFLGSAFTLGADPSASLNLALDKIFAHQNLAPFVAKQMIQHLVTSNPSKAYVQRVATAFKTSSWDMKVLIKAILLDNEARLQAQANVNTYGRLREPFLRVMGMMRGIVVNHLFVAETDHVIDDTLALNLNNAPLRAPTVFNDFSPNYVAAGGLMAAQNKVTPQMQIATETATVAYANAVYDIIDKGIGQNPTNTDNSGQLKISDLVTASTTPAQMVNIINRKLFGDGMSADLKSIVLSAATGTASYINRFKAALYVAVMSTEYMVQR